ncbi:hypothetical protein AXE65_10280 [Ventosimonas gracilis]|uniref:Uncharacterized protein n=1 Tax=Ventosimonas gracilis TaxID=1680762 RepID=A0A139SXB6_9GAMM|nr:hypothetical protein [Ventosimonas gracilis]KXU39090.1 hypothetical protein AXE65_10280 [Ventosimonas gracilis]
MERNKSYSSNKENHKESRALFLCLSFMLLTLFYAYKGSYTPNLNGAYLFKNNGKVAVQSMGMVTAYDFISPSPLLFYATRISLKDLKHNGHYPY